MQLRKKCAPRSIAERLTLISDMIIIPMITLFLFILNMENLMGVATTAFKTFFVWRDWIEYNDLRLEVQRMFFHTMAVGGPFISTNDPAYMPYVFAEAVYRVPVGIAKAPPGGTLAA